MIPDTDEQLIAEAKKHGASDIEDGILFDDTTQLRALINHYIALDRAQGQKPVCEIRYFGKIAGLVEISDLSLLPNGTRLYTRAQPIAEAK